MSVRRSLRMGVAAVALCSFSASAVAPLDVRMALVIGNSAYEGGAALDNPGNDASAMADALKRLGFSVTQVRDGTREQMLDAIESMEKRMHNRSAVGMLYYAGHGLQLNWRNYMVPVNARLTVASDVSQQSVDVDVVLQAFKAAGNRMNIVVLDACRDNPFFAAGSDKGLAQMDAPPGTLLAYATAPGNVADDGSLGSNGLYTGFLLRELTRPASKIEDVFKRVRLQVRQSSKGSQVPWESTSLEEDFFFNDGVKNAFRLEDLDRLGQQARARAQGGVVEAQLAESKEQQEMERVAAPPKVSGPPSKKQEELEFQREKTDWDRISSSHNPDDFYAYLLRYPSGSISELATAALERLARAKTKPVVDRDGMVQVAGNARFQLGDKHYYYLRDDLTKTSRPGLMQVTQVNEDTVEINNGQDVYTHEGATIRNRIVSKMDPPRLDMPAGDYAIGKRWNYRSLKTLAIGQNVGVSFGVNGRSRITALEQVSVAAGTFKAYRLELEEFGDDGTHLKMTRWMLPGWGFPIKMERELRRRYGSPEIETMEMSYRERVGG